MFSWYISGDEVSKQFWSTMASSVTLEVFNANVESIDNYKERLDFYYMTNQFSEGWKSPGFSWLELVRIPLQS